MGTSAGTIALCCSLLAGGGCATTVTQSATPQTASASTAEDGEASAQASHSRGAHKLDPEEHYRRVMRRASRRGIRVIWVNPPKQALAENLSPPQLE